MNRVHNYSGMMAVVTMLIILQIGFFTAMFSDGSIFVMIVLIF